MKSTHTKLYNVITACDDYCNMRDPLILELITSNKEQGSHLCNYPISKCRLSNQNK